ncbi:MAG: aminoimidazole riboside kinase [Gammaproteobacteria bacterium]|nr:aminoimidazole riboside kinase [Gammaproteobacteria bacterium]
MPQCWVIGDAAVDLIPEGDKYLKFPGGTGANVAVALSRLGVRSALITKLGNDPLADFLTDTLEREKVNTQHVSFSERYKTGLIIISINSTGERHFTHMVKPSADSQLNNSDMPAFEHDDWLCVSAFILAQRAAREATFLAIKKAKMAGSVVCVDANMRVDMWDNESLKVPTTLEALKMADIAKMSEDELLLLTNTNSIGEGIKVVKQWPAKIKIITLAERGAILLTEQAEFHIAGYKVPVVDTTGAGDAFIAALISRLMSLDSWTDNQLIEAVTFSNACGALVVEKKGAMSALPDLGTVRKFMVEQNQDVEIK